MKRLKRLLLLAIFLGGCATTDVGRLADLSLNMSKEQVARRLGKPTAVKEPIKNQYQQNIEVWEYALTDIKVGRVSSDVIASIVSVGIYAPRAYKNYQNDKKNITNYWLYFCDNKLVQWIPAKDWKRESEKILKTDFNIEVEPSP